MEKAPEIWQQVGLLPQKSMMCCHSLHHLYRQIHHQQHHQHHHYCCRQQCDCKLCDRHHFDHLTLSHWRGCGNQHGKMITLR